MAERRVKVVLSAEVQGYRQAMEQAAAATKKTKESAETLGKSTTESGAQASKAAAEQAAAAKRTSDAWVEVGQAATLAGAVTLAGVGVAVKSFMDFDKQMSSVQAATNETAGNMEALRDAAMDAGAKTAFSAVEAAQGIEELAKAGVSTEDILSGGLSGALDLAAAGELAVGDAAEIAATAMTQFKLSGEQIPKVADLLAAGAGKAQGTVADMGAALNQAGLVASATGLSIEETTGTLAAFASAGLVGSDAGTSFKSMLQKLQNPSKEAAGVMSDLGISMYDSEGAFVGMSDLAGQLQTNMADLTQAERDKAMATIFGSDAVRASNVLYEQGSAGIQEWVAAVDDAGYAAETAAAKQNNLAGDLEKLGGSFETMLINIGAGADGPLRGFVQGLEGLVNAVGELPQPVLAAGLGFATLLGGAALLGGGLITVLPKVMATRDALNTINAAGGRGAKGLSMISKAASGAAIGLAAVAAAAGPLTELGNKGSKATGENADALERFAGEAGKGAVAADTLNKSFSDLVLPVEGMSDFQAAIEATGDPGIWGNISNIAAQTAQVISFGMVDITSTTEEARNRFAAMGDELASLDAEGASVAFQSIAEQTDGSAESLSKLLEYMPAYRDSLEAQAKAAGMATDDQTLLGLAMGELTPKADAAAIAVEAQGAAAEQAAALNEEMQQALADIGVSADGAITSLETFVGVLQAAGLLQLSANDAARGYEEAIDSIQPAIDGLIAKNGSLAGVLNDTATGFNLDTEAGREASAAFDQVASSGAGLTQAMADNGASQAELQANLRGTYDSLITAAGQFGITGAEADTLARNVMGIPPEANVDTWMSDSAKVMAEDTKGAVEGVPDQVTVNSWMDGAAKAMAEATTTAAKSIPDQENIDSWMSDAAFVEALRTRAAALGIPEQEVIDSFMSSAARDEADATTARVLGIPAGASVSSFMANYARIEADSTTAAVNNIPSYKEVEIRTVQTFETRGVPFKVADPVGALMRNIPGRATGGRLPSTGPGTERTDGILGLSAMTGAPVSWLDGGEWVVNAKSSDKWHRLIGAINRDDPALSKLHGFAGGGRMSRDYPVVPSYSVSPQGPQGPMQMVGTLTMDSGEVLGTFRGIATQVADQRISAASRESSTMRRGRA